MILLTNIFVISSDTKSIFLSNQQCMMQSTLINFHSNKYIEGLPFYLVVILHRCTGSCKTVDNLSNRMPIPNKTDDVNLSVFDMTPGISESQISTKHVSCQFKGKFGSKKCNFNQKWNNNKCRCACKYPNIMSAKQMIFGILLYVFVKW